MVLMICPVTNADLHSGVIAFERSGHLMFSIMEWMMTLNQWVFLICNFLIHPTFILLDSAAVGQKLMASEATQDGRRSEVAWHRFRVPTTQDRKRLGSWIVELQSRTMVVDRLAVDVSGEKYIGAKVDGSERVVARRFAYTWAIDHQEDREVRSGVQVEGLFLLPTRGHSRGRHRGRDGSIQPALPQSDGGVGAPQQGEGQVLRQVHGPVRQ